MCFKIEYINRHIHRSISILSKRRQNLGASLDRIQTSGSFFVL